MKTVGDVPPKKQVVIGDAHYYMRDQALPDNPDIPTVDFGLTMSYMPTTRRPSISDTLNKVGHGRSGSDTSVGRREKKHLAQGNANPGQGESRRNIPWQPGMAAGRPESPNARLTPEQFVLQRAASNHVVSSPVLLHRRGSSTPSVMRPASSGDWPAHSRQQSYIKDLPPRPHSRGASTIFGHNDIASHLSAREQEHVARVTGSSFFNLSSNNVKQPAPVHGGLLSAIDTRERERKGFKEGVSNQMVQQAIAQRQQLQQHQQMHEAQQTQMYAAQQQAKGQSIYDLPMASRTWDTFNHFHQKSPVVGQGPDLWSNPPMTPRPTHHIHQPSQHIRPYPS
jgi:CCR4-NOT transcriptional complex subunit CAF120